jgi:hypothetical protein
MQMFKHDNNAYVVSSFNFKTNDASSEDPLQYCICLTFHLAAVEEQFLLCENTNMKLL